MKSLPFSQADEDAWHETLRRRELRRCLISLAQLADTVQFTEDFVIETPTILARLIRVTAELLARGIDTTARNQDLEQINTVLGIITPHLRYVERAQISQTPWSIVQSAERLLKLAVGSESHFIIRPSWSYNYSVIGEFASVYREILSCWPWFNIDEWKEQVGLKNNESIYCISFPRIEKANCLLHANWGHEVGHILVARWVAADFGTVWTADESQMKRRIEDQMKKNPPSVDPLFKDMVIQEAVAEQMRATMEVARQGLIELLCDRVGIHLLGPAALAATMEYAARFAMDISPLQSSNYPPWRYRLRKMFEHCEPDLKDYTGVGYPNIEIAEYLEWLKVGSRLSAASTDLDVIKSSIITKEAYEFVSRHWEKAAEKVIAMLPPALARPYRMHENHDVIGKLVLRLKQGIPPNEIAHLSGQPASFQDILVAAWAYKIHKITKNPGWGNSDEYDLLFRLVLKGCESSYVHLTWGDKIDGEKL